MAVKDVGSRIRRRGTDARPVVAFGRRQVDHRAQPDGERSGFRAIGQRDHACPARQRDRGRALSFRLAARVRQPCAMPMPLLEWAEVHGNFYATPRGPAEKAMAEGRDMLFDIDWQGAKQLKEKMRGDIVSIFILPPSMKELKARLKRRAEDQEAVIETQAEERPHRNRALDASTISSSSTTTSTAPSARSARSSPASACAATAGQGFSTSCPDCWTRRCERVPSLLRGGCRAKRSGWGSPMKCST